ncbi:MAG TPA: TRAP transporter large permease [Bacillales bacterium]|nr:TRAP transporter large permease [Bacillales bacterium]
MLIPLPFIVLVLFLVLFLVLNAPIFVALGLSSVVLAFLFTDTPLNILSGQFYSNLASFPLMAVPFFLLASGIMEHSTISRKIVNMADAVVGSFRGGLAITGLVACAMFASISGSSLATVATIGNIVIPKMLEKGYDKRLAIGSIVAGGTLGIIIPPSVPLIIYGTVTGTSVVKLFLAGIVPGLIIVAALLIAIIIFANKGWDPGEKRTFTFQQRGKMLRDGVWTLIIPFVIFVGIYGVPGFVSAIFTPTEASMVTILTCLVVAGVIYRDFRYRDIPRVVAKSAPNIGMILMIVGSALLFSFELNNERIPQMLANYLVSIDLSPIVFLLMVNLTLLVAGVLMDATPIILIFMPVLFPSAVALGIDPIHFGILTVVNLEIGCITPPVGVNLFMASAITKQSMLEVIRSAIPWVFILLLILLLVTYVPAITLFLPNLMGN